MNVKEGFTTKVIKMGLLKMSPAYQAQSLQSILLMHLSYNRHGHLEMAAGTTHFITT